MNSMNDIYAEKCRSGHKMCLSGAFLYGFLHTRGSLHFTSADINFLLTSHRGDFCLEEEFYNSKKEVFNSLCHRRMGHSPMKQSAEKQVLIGWR